MSRLNKVIKLSVFILGLSAFGLVPVAQAMADQRQDRSRSYNNQKNSHNSRRHNDRRDYGRKSDRRDYGRKSDRRNYGRNSSKRYDKRHNYKKYGYNRNNYRGYYGYSRNRHNRGRGGEVALGVLTGGLLFYALTANQRSQNNDRTVYVQQQPTYTQPQQQWTQPQQPVQPQNDPSCLQVREYQTTITVGGQSVPAYGQSCLQADGSWKLGPAIPEPNY